MYKGTYTYTYTRIRMLEKNQKNSLIVVQAYNKLLKPVKNGDIAPC